jgi:hypothetical protein
MKSRYFVFFILFASCVSNNRELLENKNLNKNSQEQEIEENHELKEKQEDTKISFFEGDAGKGISIAVLQPDGKDLISNESWILPLIQGSLAGDFNKYSLMSVIDRQYLDKILLNQQEATSGYYSDEDYIALGKLINAQYVLVGSIMKRPTKTYILDLTIVNATSGERIASYPTKQYTYDQIFNLLAVKEAAVDLLSQLGIKLTDEGKRSLLDIETNKINAEVALSKGITAQKNGTVIEALSYYYSAVEFDSSVIEANDRLQILSSYISSGNIGENVRNDIEKRKAWLEILSECENYFSSHLPYEIVYDPSSL